MKSVTVRKMVWIVDFRVYPEKLRIKHLTVRCIRRGTKKFMNLFLYHFSSHLINLEQNCAGKIKELYETEEFLTAVR